MEENLRHELAANEDDAAEGVGVVVARVVTAGTPDIGRQVKLCKKKYRDLKQLAQKLNKQTTQH